MNVIEKVLTRHKLRNNCNKINFSSYTIHTLRLFRVSRLHTIRQRALAGNALASKERVYCHRTVDNLGVESNPRVVHVLKAGRDRH